MSENAPSLARYKINAETCIACAACASIAPELFAVENDVASMVRQPETTEEAGDAEAAAAACPVEAIVRE